MPKQEVKLSPDDEMVLLAQWHNLVTDVIFEKTVLSHIDRRLDKLKREKKALREQPKSLDNIIKLACLDDREAELSDLKDSFAAKSRKYQTKLKGDTHYE